MSDTDNNATPAVLPAPGDWYPRTASRVAHATIKGQAGKTAIELGSMAYMAPSLPRLAVIDADGSATEITGSYDAAGDLVYSDAAVNACFQVFAAAVRSQALAKAKVAWDAESYDNAEAAKAGATWEAWPLGEQPSNWADYLAESSGNKGMAMKATAELRRLLPAIGEALAAEGVSPKGVVNTIKRFQPGAGAYQVTSVAADVAAWATSATATEAQRAAARKAVCERIERLGTRGTLADQYPLGAALLSRVLVQVDAILAEPEEGSDDLALD